MSSYVVIELDTTPPIINIFAPKYTTKDVINTITIESNERLSDYQDIYIIDSLKNKYNLTFERISPFQYIGNVKFNNLSLGIATIYTIMKDEVDNYSLITSFTFEIKESLNKVDIKIKDKKYTNIEIDDREYINIEVEDRKYANIIISTSI